MKTSDILAVLIVNLILILAIIFIPFWLSRALFGLVLAAIWITKISIFMLKFRHEKLKKWFPKNKWMIQRLHEKYVYEANGFTKNEMADMQKRYSKFVERAKKQGVQNIPTFQEYSGHYDYI